ncbi:hypothetical protein [Candidatus Nitrospira salsa]
MRIENLRSETIDRRARIAAQVIWEDCGRSSYELYFETPAEFASDLSCNPHAFLIACLIPAMHYGEKRVAIEGKICPELRDGLTVAMSCLRHWYYPPDYKLVSIDAKSASTWPAPCTPKRAGLFFTGGIDSFATLRSNLLGYPLEHPGSIKDALLVYGLELDASDAFSHVVNSLSAAAKKANITLIPVYTNLYTEYRCEDKKNKFKCWVDEFEGAALSAVAHAFINRLSMVFIASTFDIPNLHPHGSHPLLDPNYSSRDMRICHQGISLSRFAKTKLVAGWDIALKHLRVCNQYHRYQSGMLNCGKCEKCVRTMLALLACGGLNQTHAFPHQEVSAELLRIAINMNKTTFPFYGELLLPLAEKCCHDYVRVIEEKMAEYHKFQLTDPWRVKVRELDKKYTKGRFLQAKRALFS